MEVGKMNVPWLAVCVWIVNVSYLLRKCRLDCVLSKSIINNFFGKLELVFIELLLLEGSRLLILFEFLFRFQITDCFDCVIEFFPFFFTSTFLESLFSKHLFEGF